MSWWLTTKKAFVDLRGQRGYYTVGRWHGQRYGPMEFWWVKSGFKCVEQLYIESGVLGRHTAWRLDGTVELQNGRDGVRKSPPWWWNTTDQTAPSMPAWMKDDEQWQRALDEQD